MGSASMAALLAAGCGSGATLVDVDDPVLRPADPPALSKDAVEDNRLLLFNWEPKQFGKLLGRVVLDARANLVSQAPGAKHITNTDSGHYIHQEQPQLVIDSVREVLDAVEQQSPSSLTDTGGVPPLGFLLASALLLGTSLLVARWVVSVR